ncbi:hypothetical protein Xcc3_30360 [Xanthomonas campestris pv. campestris]|nr:hypothetical protein Xcc3_30360 [Xanthomonas campestris pv. campestris]
MVSLIDDHRHIGGPVGLHIAYYVAGCKKACARPVNGRHTKRCRVPPPPPRSTPTARTSAAHPPGTGTANTRQTPARLRLSLRPARRHRINGGIDRSRPAILPLTKFLALVQCTPERA